MPEDLTISVDDEEIAAVMHEPDGESCGTIIFAHGFGSDKEGSYVGRAERAVTAGYVAIRFDFRGNHKSSRSFDEATLTSRIADLRSVIAEAPVDPVYVYGSSFGGLITIQSLIQGDDRVAACALRAPVTYLAIMDDIREAIKQDGRYEQLPGKWVDERFLDDLMAYETAGHESAIDVPMLLIHGAKDEVVPVRFSEEFYEELDGKKQLRIVGGEGHRFSENADADAVDAALDWFDGH